MNKWRIRTGDFVIVTSGSYKGKKGEILRVDYKSDRVFVSGVNICKKHKKPANGESGAIVDIEASLHKSNVALFDAVAGKASRIGFKFINDGKKKVRYFKKSGEVVR